QIGWLYYGLIPNGVPVGAVVGCGAGGGVGAGFVGNQETMAHELGHQLGRVHAPCGNVGTADPNYPIYEPYDSPPAMGVNPSNASIGEYGLDTRSGNIHRPQNTKDFMSYCSPRWISLYGYQAFINSFMLNPTAAMEAMTVSNEEINKGAPADLISVLGFVNEDGTYQVLSVARVVAYPNAPFGERTDTQLELLRDDGTKLAYGWVHLVGPE